MKRLLRSGFLAGGIVALTSGSAFAIPSLQLYIEGATYDVSTETWVLASSGTFTLWVMSTDAVFNVKLATAVETAEISGASAAVTTTTSTLTCGSSLCDLSGAPAMPVMLQQSADGAVPVTGDGTPLPTHGIYGPGVSFFEWSLGDFTATSDPIGDFQYTFPTTFPDSGQINAYSVTVSGLSWIHFDAYDHIIVGKNHTQYKFAPFSHDGEADVAEPDSVTLVGAGLAALVAAWRRRQGAG